MAINPLSKTIKKCLPATVTISVFQKNKEVGKKTLKDLLNTKKEFTNVGSGSGFIVSKDGTIISNRHVISDPNLRYKVMTYNGGIYEAKVVSRDPLTDIAILKINSAKDLPFIKLGNSSKLELGESVLAIGNALGIFQNTVSLGIISGMSRSITAQIDANSSVQEIHGLIQTDAAINPGNSGGPLINLKGEVIGINIAIITGAQNIGLALPINVVKKDLEDIKKFGKIKKPYLGVRYLIIDDYIKEKYSLLSNFGAYVRSEKPYSPSIIENSPAKKAGLKDKDIILTCDGQKICKEASITDILENHDAGDIIEITVLRGSKEIKFKVTLAELK